MGTKSSKGAESRRWEPLTLKELSESPLFGLKRLSNKNGVKVDSLMTTSLGQCDVGQF